MQTLVEIVRDLDPLLREHLGAVRIEPHADGFTATLSFCPYEAARQPSETLGTETVHHVLTADLHAPPPGVAATAADRWPDEIVELDPATPADAQIRQLDASGLVGRVRAARLDAPDGGPTRAWIAETHAGSDAERANWLLSLGREEGQER
jgi:hypothetical protein